jgi:hypothetical protein
MNPDAPHQHFPPTNVEPGPTADTTQRLESVESKGGVVGAMGHNVAVLVDALPHRHFPATNIEPGPTADTTQRLESVESKEEAEEAAKHQAVLNHPAPPHEHFPLTNEEPEPGSDVTRRFESVEAKLVEGSAGHKPVPLTTFAPVPGKPDPLSTLAVKEVEHAHPLHSIIGEVTPKAEDTKNPMDKPIQPKAATTKAPSKGQSIAVAAPPPNNMWWDGNLPRRTGELALSHRYLLCVSVRPALTPRTPSAVVLTAAFATLLGAIAYGAYMRSLEW